MSGPGACLRAGTLAWAFGLEHSDVSAVPKFCLPRGFSCLTENVLLIMSPLLFRIQNLVISSSLTGLWLLPGQLQPLSNFMHVYFVGN